MAEQNSKACVVILHLPLHLVGRPVEDIKRVLAQPANRTLDILAAECHRMINNPDVSLDLLIARVEAERKAQSRGAALPSDGEVRRG